MDETKKHSVLGSIGVAALCSLIIAFEALLFTWWISGVPSGVGFILLVAACVLGVIYRRDETETVKRMAEYAIIFGLVLGVLAFLWQLYLPWDYIDQLYEMYEMQANQSTGVLNDIYYFPKLMWSLNPTGSFSALIGRLIASCSLVGAGVFIISTLIKEGIFWVVERF